MPTSACEPRLDTIVRVRPRGLRSINLVRDLDQTEVAAEYSLTAQTRRTLRRILEGADGHSPNRAWTITGPYGSGKSYFALFLLNVLSASLPSHAQSIGALQEADNELAEMTRALLRRGNGRGLFPIPILGYRTSLEEALMQGVRNALESVANTVPPRGLSTLQRWFEAHDSRSIVTDLESLARVVTSPSVGYSGLILVFDELGKSLEYTAAHDSRSDVHLLQEIAELANRSGQAPMLFIGVLHQSFDRYTGGLDSATQREWAKVQGRFEDIAFQEPPDQQVRLLASLLEVKDGPTAIAQQDAMATAARAAADASWLPLMMKPDEFAELARAAYPLHPTTLVALPYVFRRLAQNERSLVAYLTSQEPFGFQEFLRTHSLPDTVRLTDLFDYLVSNYQARLYAGSRARALTETIERLGSSRGLSPVSVDVLKTIGLLNWLSEVGPVQGNEESLLAALRAPDRTDQQIRRELDELRSRSVIVYRGFNRTFGVWQGSDVDIDERMSEAGRQLAGAFGLAQTLQDLAPSRPAVAHRHSFTTGTLRYCDVRFVDSQSRDQLPLKQSPAASGLLLLAVPSTEAEEASLRDWALHKEPEQCDEIVVCLEEHSAGLAQLARDLRCLNWVRENTPELRDDPVARRELRARVPLVTTRLQNLVQPASQQQSSESASRTWFWRGQNVSADALRGVSHLLSGVCDLLYDKSPRIRNELINRRALSSQAAAARRNLLEAMLVRSQRKKLGIDGYPPELSIYECLLRAGGLHRAVAADAWVLAAPSAADPLTLRPAWDAMAGYVFAQPPQPRSVDGLFAVLRARPFGLLDGVLPVLFCAFVQVNADEVTLYREGSLLPAPGVADWEVLLRRPDLFAVAGCHLEGAGAAVVARLARGLATRPATVPVVRELLRRVNSLPGHAQRTQRLPASALAVRQAVRSARSPESLLFQDLPAALGLPPLATETGDPEAVDRFFAGLNGALQELAGATPALLASARDQLLEACGLPVGEIGWQHFLAQAAVLAPRVTRADLLPLLKRAADAVNSGNAAAALDSALAYVANRPPRHWTDQDADRFASQARFYGELLRHELDASGQEPLTTDQQQEADRLAKALRLHLLDHGAADASVLRFALRQLLAELANGRDASEPALSEPENNPNGAGGPASE